MSDKESIVEAYKNETASTVTLQALDSLEKVASATDLSQLNAKTLGRGLFYAFGQASLNQALLDLPISSILSQAHREVVSAKYLAREMEPDVSNGGDDSAELSENAEKEMMFWKKISKFAEVKELTESQTLGDVMQAMRDEIRDNSKKVSIELCSKNSSQDRDQAKKYLGYVHQAIENNDPTIAESIRKEYPGVLPELVLDPC